MTDRQFDSFRKDQLRLYEKVKEEIEEIAQGKSKESKTLNILIDDTKEHLSRP
ncbi:MAG: hypothetical protein FWE74_03310 [Oscillospiraceae bacterium]|nr:hypothetical protein [Oscillospiraceae bacterium]